MEEAAAEFGVTAEHGPALALRKRPPQAARRQAVLATTAERGPVANRERANAAERLAEELRR